MLTGWHQHDDRATTVNFRHDVCKRIKRSTQDKSAIIKASNRDNMYAQKSVRDAEKLKEIEI